MLKEETKKKLCECYRFEDNNTRFSVCTLGLELTRRCNLNCLHCMKGDAQSVDMDDQYIDSLFSQVGVIYLLALAGGEITLVPERLRYVLKSAKRYNVHIERVTFITNGVILSNDILEIWDDFLEYVANPQKSQIVISSDKFHKLASGMSETELKKHCQFYRRGKRGAVLLQDVGENPRNIKRVGRLEKSPHFDDPNYKEKFIARYLGSSQRIGKYPIKHYGNHICVLQLTALGNIQISDIITYIDEDKDAYHNGNITEGLENILNKESQDPYLNSVGIFINYFQDLEFVVQKIAEPVSRNILAQIGIPFGLKMDSDEMRENLLLFKELFDIIMSLKSKVLSNMKREDEYICNQFYKQIETQLPQIEKLSDML